MKKLLLSFLLILISQQLIFSQTIVQGEANKEPSLLSISIGAKQWFTKAASKPINSFFVGIGRMPTLEKPFYFDLSLYFLPSYDFEYTNRYNRRTFRGDTKAAQAASLGLGILIASKYSKSKIHPMVGFGTTINTKPGYRSISPAYIESDDIIDNNGISFGFHPNVGLLYKLSPQMILYGKFGYAIQNHKNQFKPNEYNLYDNHFFSEIGIKLNFFK